MVLALVMDLAVVWVAIGPHHPASAHAAASAAIGVKDPSAQGVKITADDATLYDAFGTSLAMDASTLIVGAPGKDTATGAAYVFVRSGGIWYQQAKLLAPNRQENDWFGAAVGLSGDTAIIGAYGRRSNTGTAYVFVRSGDVWTRQARLRASDGGRWDAFGSAVAISGSTAVNGAWGWHARAGAAYVFERSGHRWTQQARLKAPGPDFGRAVAVSGSTVVVGAPRRDENMGAAYVFARTGTTWSRQDRLIGSDPGQQDVFGASVAISGSTAEVGAPNHDQGRGAVYLFARSGDAWPQEGELTASDGQVGAEMGYSVAVDGSATVLGAPGKNIHAGVGYLFGRTPVSWRQWDELIASDGAQYDALGVSVAIAGTTAVVGAPDNANRTGAAYAFG
jgi:hypothetical protein